MTIEQLFFELIQVALGVRVCLSHSPTSEEWTVLYDLAKKQSLVGICFSGVQHLCNSETSDYCGMNELQYLTWMGMTAKIQQRNEVVNRQCVELQKRLSADGLRSSILKGQGVGALYCVNGGQKRGETSTGGSDPAIEKNVEISGNTTSLQLLRQSGDIDVFVAGGMKKVLGYCTEKFGKVEWDYINAHAPFYTDTEVEMHWRAQAMTNLFANKRLQEWFKSEKVQSAIIGGRATLANGEDMVVPSAEFNAFYILLHCYHHMFESGLGLRQLMDYYFVLRDYKTKTHSTSLRAGAKTPEAAASVCVSESECNTSTSSAHRHSSSASQTSATVFNGSEASSGKKQKKQLSPVKTIEQFGMKKFAEGVLWLIWHVFEGENPDSFLVTPNSSFLTPNSKEGRFLLNEVMQNGNFGHHDERVKKVGSGKMSELWRNVQHNWHLASHYPAELFWQPVWLAYHYFWKRMIKK